MCWKYDDEYSIYNYPSWNEITNNKWAITLPQNRQTEFFALTDEYHNLCGYVRIQYKFDYILIGLGLKPSLCSHGLGNTFMNLIKEQCATLYPNIKIILEVRSFNNRAIKCYKKARFVIKEIYI